MKRRGSTGCVAAGMVLAGLLGAQRARAVDLFVDASTGSDTADGLSWATPKASVSAALAALGGVAGTHVVSVAEGCYAGSITVTPDTTLQGGFPSGGGVRDPAAHETILDGRESGTVVFFNEGTDGSILDGFTVTGGRYTEPFPSQGAGITISYAAPLIRKCRIEGNTGTRPCAGIYTAYGVRATVVEESTIRGNYGAAVYAKADGIIDPEGPALTMRNCVVEDNSGGIVVFGDGRFENVGLRRNEGIAVVVWYGSAAFINCEISENTGEGILIGCYDRVGLQLGNVTIARNLGPAVSAFRGSGLGIVTLDVHRSILSENTDPTFDPGRCMGFAGTVADSIVQGGYAGGTNVLDVDPLFVPGPAGGSYLSQVAAGQSTDSPAVDAGPELASDVGLDMLTTRTDAVPDAGLADWGFHYADEAVPPPPTLTVYRSDKPASLPPVAKVASLPWTDTGVVGGTNPDVLFYTVVPAPAPLHVVRARAVGGVELSF